MKKTCTFIAGALWISGCGASGGNEADGPPSFGNPPNGGGGNPGGVAGNTGIQGGSSGTPGIGQGQGGAGTVPVGSAGNGQIGEGNGGAGQFTPPNGGNGNPGNGGSGNAGNGASGASSGTGEPGDFVSVPVNGGASAAFVCPDGVFGDPLTGMGAITSVAAPQGSFFAFIEGPVWVGSENRLFFSDNASGPERIWRIDPPFTTPVIFMPNSGSNGLAIDNEDQLLVADQAQDRITRVSTATPPQVIDTVVPTGPHNPNDLVMRSDDNLYFTDPNGPGRGFYRVSPSGELSGPFSQSNTENAPGAPNGIVLSPDENTVYVGDVQQNFVARFDLQSNGEIDTESGEVFVRTQGNTVDGMAVDCAGNLYIGTMTGVEVYRPDASFIGTVPTGEASNATFGGADRRTLFVTSRSVLKFVTLAVPGLPN